MTEYAGKQSTAATAGPTTAGPGAPGPGKNTLVGQIQSPVETGGGAPAGPTALSRVQAAANAKDLAAVVAIQVELVGQLQQQASDPPKDLRDGIAFARTWTMDQIAAIRDKYEPQVITAKSTTGQGTDNSAAVEAIEVREDAECKPYLDALMKGDPQYRYLHFNQVVQDKVFAAVRLHSTRRALTGVGDKGHRKEAEAEARSVGSLASGSWCGVFAFANAVKGGGMDPYWAGAMQGEGGIRSALTYFGKPIWVWTGDHWESIKQYHLNRGSQRYYEVLGAGLPARAVQPGDLALLDRDFGLDPDHIMTVSAYDGRYLYTIGGNQGTDKADDEKGVSRSGPFDLSTQPAPNDVTEWGPPGPDGKPTKGRKAGVAKNVRIHGIGRWSIVDYETHVYSLADKMPTAKPSDQALTDKEKLPSP